MATRWHRRDYETPTVEAAAGFERYYGEDPWDRDLDARQAVRDREDDDAVERRRARQAEREGR